MVTSDKNLFTHFWITWLIGITDAITKVESNSFAFSSLSELYLVLDATAPLTNPSAGEISIDIAGEEIKIHKTPLGGGVSLDLDNLDRVQLYSDKALATAFDDLTIVDNTTYYTITSTSSISTGTYNINDVLTVTFHW